jgi:SAM-dependent methyltransferase
MTNVDTLLSISDWRHPHQIDGQKVRLAKDWYANWHPWRWSVDLPVIASATGPLAGKRVLDVGCNDGWYAFQAAQEGAHAVGIDLRQEAIDRANMLREHYAATHTSFFRGNVEEAQTVYGNFDATLCYGLLYHLADPINVMRRLGAVTRRIICVQTFIHALDRAPVLHLLREGVGLPGKGATELITTPTQRAVVLMLQEAGFDHVYRAMPTDYRRQAACTGSNGEWQWAFFYGVKGDELPGHAGGPLRIGENDAPLNHYGPLSQSIGWMKASAKRFLGRDTIGGF